MFCFQCQETAKNISCTVKGVCGKPEETANLQDLLIFVLKGIAVYSEKLKELGNPDRSNDDFATQGLFATITNANWDDARFVSMINEGLKRKDLIRSKFLAAYKEKNNTAFDGLLPEAATWTGDVSDFAEKAKIVGILTTKNEDVRSLRELLIIGLKGVAAYADHAAVLGCQKDEINDFIMEALASTTKDLSVDEMIAMVMKAGEIAVNTMALLDEANTTAYGNPEITEVNIGVGKNPGILISGHDLKDMEELLKQTDGTGIDVYTHGEMLPKDTVILTAGCAKYRYNKLDLGDIGGIPRVLDAGQCNDSYSLAVIALKLKEVFGLDDINDLPISYDIAWYEQKAVAVLLALLFLGVKGIRLGPTLPAFLSPAVAKVLVEKFDIKPIGKVDEDIAAMMAGN
ncbi:hypothetical protein [Desulfobacter postgatei]|uniref:hypothetical protein n=1 Tax=Desulfobacter postgatei TaxID=2293 RepID=UPI00259AF25F|nr:hypothetical protein [uncultured Desulfobacter sp.]